MKTSQLSDVRHPCSRHVFCYDPSIVCQFLFRQDNLELSVLCEEQEEVDRQRRRRVCEHVAWLNAYIQWSLLVERWLSLLFRFNLFSGWHLSDYYTQWLYTKHVCWLWSIFFINEAYGNFAWSVSENSFCRDILKSECIQAETNYEHLGFCVGRERLLICLCHISACYWSWALSKVIAQNLWLLKGIWSWRFKCHINWLLGRFCILFRNHSRRENSTTVCYFCYM